MAYMIGDEGPYPNKAGEWAMNVSERDAHWYRAPLRIGRPRVYPDVNTEGLVGLYLRDDCALPKDAVEVPTPLKLTEPGPDTEREPDEQAR